MSGRRILIFMLYALLLSASSVSYAFDYSKGNRQYYVLRVESDEVAYDVDGDEDDHQTDGGQYSSSHWDEPYPKHADSLNDLFALMISGDNVYFLGDVSFDVSSTIEISKDLNIYGSFPYTSGNNGKFEERDIKTRPTTFDAHNERRVFHITGGAKVTLDSLKITGGGAYRDNGGVYVEGGCNIVVRSCDVVSSGIVDDANYGRGITVIESTALVENCLIADNYHSEPGSGIYADSSDVVIRNCTFTGNVSRNDNGGTISLANGTTASVSVCTITENVGSHTHGTGVYVNASRLNIQSCDISRNKNEQGNGCGIALDEGSYAYISNCTITSNDTYWLAFGGSWVEYYGNGGGIAVMGMSSADIVSCDISRNTGNYGGGVHVGTKNVSGKSVGDGVSSVTIKDCKISDNFCGYNHRGGGIDIDSAAAEITNCTISGNVVSGENWANTFGGGVHIYYPGGPVTITDCLITGNFANNSGGGVYATGSWTSDNYTPVIKNCLISNNSATKLGGGIYVSGVYLAVDNCTITGNKTPGIEDNGYGREEGGGGGVYVGDAALLMTNSTVTKNSTYYGAGGGGIYYNGTTWSANMISNCSIVDNSARNGGIEIQRDGYVRASRIPFINSLIYNPTSPDKSFVNKDSERSMFFNCAIPESLALPSTSPSFDIVKIASWTPVSSTETINGITHTVYRIEDNPALKPIVGAGANRVIYSNSYYTPDVNYTSPSFDQVGTTRVNSPDIGAMEKAVTVPVLSADASIHVVVSNEITPLTIADTEPNKALTWTLSGDVPSGVTASEDANGMTYTLSGAPTAWGDYSFSVIASNAKGNDDVKVSVIVYTAPVLSDDAEIKAVKGTAMSQTFPAVSGNHLAWTLSGDVPSGLSVSSDDDSFTVSGTPATAGDYSFKLTASNMAGSDDIAVNVIVYEAPLLPDNIVTVEAVKDMSITERNVSASAGNHLAWSVRGNLPAGLTVHSSDNSVTATIMGTPTTAGDYDFSIIASNYAGSADIEVNAIVYEAPEISGSAVELQAVEGRAFSAREISVNSGNHLTWTRTGTFPDGMTFSGNDSALSISGTPSANSAGDYESVFTASNLAGSAKFTATITVYAPPALSDTAITINAVEGEAITTRAITVTAGNHIEWTVNGTLPGGLAVTSNDSEFTVSGIPSAGSRGSYTFNVTARNHAGSSSTEVVAVVGAKNYSLDVAEASTLATVLSGLTEYELQTIETLKLNGHVTDISSIDALPNLMALDLTEATSLVSVDLSSNDTLLSLDISGNNTIRTLDISGSSLEEVYARECASLETINAVNCANLKILLCQSSKISTLNLEGSTNLETLNFSDNALRKFDARSFASLTSLDCNGQAITDYTLRASFDVWDFIGSADSEYENMNDLKGYDDSGVEIPCDYASDTGIATFAKVPYKITYSYMVSDDVSMDVTISGGVVLRSPVILSRDIRITATEGTAIIPATMTASPADYLTWTTMGNLPGGLTGTAGRNAESFTISGTPLRGTAGNYTYTVIASNAVGSDDVVITVTVTAPSPIVEPLPPVLSGQSFSINAREGTEITALTITASSDSNISWSSSGTLPDGLTGRANSDGMSFTVSGIPSQGTAGNYAYTVTAMNSGGETSATINITVSATINSQENSSLNDALDNLTSEEASQMTSLAIGDNISDLNGLERLTNLENLDLTEANSLTEVDLSGNTSVKSVDLSGNSSITTLNLGNSNVESVNAEGSESLEEVNIEGNTSIKELNVNSTEISGLNARGCENLEVLKCSSCQITSLELEGCVNLRHLDFAGNAMRRFRATGLNNLMELSCGGQRVEVISFSLVFNLLDFLTASEASGIFEADAGDDNVKNVKGYDASGNEIATSYNQATGEVTFSQVPSKVTYDYDTGFGSDYMDVTISSSGEGSSPVLGTSNGGCGVFPSSMMLLCLTLTAIFTVKKQ